MTTVNFAASASDIITFSIASILPPNITTYTIDSLRIGNAGATLSGVTVALYTAASGGGNAIIAPTATTVTSSSPGVSNSYQVMIPASGSTTMWNNSPIYLHISTSNAASSTANVSLVIRPVY